MEGATCFVQPTWEEKKSNKSKPYPFYLSLIIGNNLVHNYMIYLGARSSVMPQCVSDSLGIEYEPMYKVL